MIQINNTSGEVIYTSEAATSLKAALEEAAATAMCLARAKLQNEDLAGAYLRNANLQGAALGSAYLQSADLVGADLYGANLQNADLRRAYLRSANLENANLQNADLQGADLQGAFLKGMNLKNANLGPRSIVPEEGAFIGWKKLRDYVIAKLEIPAEARRHSSLVGRKCRVEFVRVLELAGSTVRALELSERPVRAESMHDHRVVYTVGEIVRPDRYDNDIRLECAPGIHFFLTRKEAEEYQ